MRKGEIAVLIIVLFSFAVGIYFYPQMPERIASHWNVSGDVDGYMPRFWGAFLMPVVSLIMLLLFMLLPRIDPLKANIEKFRKHFDIFIILLTLFLFYIYVLTISWNIGIELNMTKFLMPALAVLFWFTGVLTENAKRNWFIGIRTPWTLSSDSVWDKTHRLGGKLFKASAVIAFMAVFFPDDALWMVLVPVGLTVIYTFVFSYLEYRREKRTL